MTSDDRVRAAIDETAHRLGRDAASLEGYALEEIPGGFYVFERRRGGRAAIIADSGMLIAVSGISKSVHVAAFLEGQRTPPA